MGMKRAAEGIYQRETGKYIVPVYDRRKGAKVWSHPDMPKGGFTNLNDAKAFKRDREQEKATQVREVETCDEFADRWPVDYARRQPTTNTQNKERVKVFAHDFKGIPLDGVSRQLARLWVQGGTVPQQLEEVASGWQGAEKVDGRWVVPDHRQRYKVVRAMFNDAVNDDLISRNPFAALKVPEGRGRQDIVVLTEEELGQLAETAGGVWGDYGRSVIGPLILTGAGTGMRPGELYAMRWHWVDWENDNIEIKKALQSTTGRETKPGKTRKDVRSVVLLPFVRAALQRVPRQATDDHVFFMQNGRHFIQRAHHYYWDPVRKAFWAKLPQHRRDEIPPNMDFYEMRHFFATYLARLPGVTPMDVANQLGHVDGGALAMKRYFHERYDGEIRDRVLGAVRASQEPGKKAL